MLCTCISEVEFVEKVTRIVRSLYGKGVLGATIHWSTQLQKYYSQNE